MSPRTGRPLSDNPKSARLVMRVTPNEKEWAMRFAKEHHMGLFDLMKKGIEAVEKEK